MRENHFFVFSCIQHECVADASKNRSEILHHSACARETQTISLQQKSDTMFRGRAIAEPRSLSQQGHLEHLNAYMHVVSQKKAAWGVETKQPHTRCSRTIAYQRICELHTPPMNDRFVSNLAHTCWFFFRMRNFFGHNFFQKKQNLERGVDRPKNYARSRR